MSKKKFTKSTLILFKLLLALTFLLFCATYGYAAGPAGYSEYYIPGDEDDMGLVLCSYGATACPAGYHMHTVISVTAWSDNTTIYYDQWENGYNFDPNNPGATADETYTLNAGQVMVFESANIALPRTATPPATTCTNYRNGTLIGTSTTCYDGKDRIYVAGGTVTVTRVSYIEERGVGLQGAAWEIYPLQPQLTTYAVPFGETNGWYGFQRVSTLIQATQNNTVVTVDLNHDGTPDPLYTQAGVLIGPSVTLQQGQTFLLNDVSANVAAGTMAGGAIITGSSTLQVKYLAGRTDVNNCTRGFSAFPRGFWTKDYYAPLSQPGVDLTGQASDTDYYLYNPNSAAITVNWQGTATSGSFPIPATSTVSFRTASGGAVPTGSGLYFNGSDIFWGVGSNDTDNIGGASGYAHEWGFSLLPSTMLFTEHYLGWAPDGLPLAAGQTEMGVFLTPAQDNTRVFVDFNNDGIIDQTYTLNRLQTQYITNPNGDLSGAHFWASGPFTMAYGQNSATSNLSSPALDLGYIAIPGSDFVSLVLTVAKSVSPQVVPTASGSVATFTIKVDSQKYTVDGVNVTDYLPPNWNYVVGTDTTTITRPDLTTVTGSSADPTKTGAGPYTLTWSSAQLGTNGTPGMATNQEVTITFTSRTTAVLAVGTLSQNKVKAVGTRTFGTPSQTQTFTASDFVYVTSGAVTITKTSSVPAATPVSPGDSFTYSVVVANPSASGVTLTNLSLYDALPTGVTNVAGTTTISRASTVADTFTTQAYSNNDGTQPWAGNWTETDISGTNPGPAGPTTGFVQVAGNALRFGYQASNVADNFNTGSVFTQNDGNTNWSGNWTETGDNNNPATGTIQFNVAAAGKVDFTRCGAAGCNIQRSAPFSGGNVTISFVLTQNGLAVNEFLEGDYSLNGGTTWVGMQRITTGNALSTPPGGCGNPCTISTAGATSLTVRFQETTRWATNTHHAQVDNVNIAFNDSIGSAAQRTANLTGATSATLNFTYASANLAGTDTVVVQASNAAAGPFTTLATFTAGTPNVAPPYNLTTYISANTTIRFLVTGGINAPTKTFSVDNVTLAYNTSLAGANPPELVSSSSAYNLTPGETLTASFDVTVDNPLAAGIDTITNTASTTSTQFPIQLSASVTNLVVNPSSGSASVGNRVWLDSDGDGVPEVGEPGLANVEVMLKDQFGTPVMVTTTDATGHYQFTGVKAGSGYYVEATSSTIPSGLTQSAATGSNNRTSAFNLTAGQSYTSANLGYKPVTGTATIGNFVWSDANADNIRNPGEPGIAGVTVRLYIDTNRNGTYEAGTDTLCTIATCGTNGTTTTAPDGSYLFTGVTASGTQDYIVYIDETALLAAGYVRTSPPSGGPLFSIMNVSAGASILYANFGYQGTTYSIAERVWFDVNGSGTPDAGESGIGLVTVELLDASLNAIATTTTDANGYFTFSGVKGGGANYTVKITDTNAVLANYFGTTVAATAGSEKINNLSGNIDYTSTPHFGFNLSRSISGTVFNDNGAGGGTLGDGIKNGSEPGISGVVVKLYNDANGNGQINAPSDAVIATVTTDANGNYIFSGLSNGNYIVSIESPPAGYTYAGTDSDAGTTGQQRAASIVSNGNAPNINFGYHASTPRSVSGTLWEDTNKNGVMDSGEADISGVTIDLLNASLAVVATATTDAHGFYSFTGIASGTPYYVKITDNNGVLSGYTPTYQITGGTAGPFTGQETVNLSSGDKNGVNFGYYNPIPTLAVISYFGAYEKDGKVIVQWETASEINTLGFNLLRLDPLTGEYKQVNSGLLPSMLKPHRGGKYTFKDTGSLPGKTYTYKLIEIEVDGNERSYGPFAVFPARITDDKGLDLSTNADYGRTERDKPEMHKVRTDGRKSGQPGNVKTGSGERIKISVMDSGIYYVDAKDISSLLGISADKIPSMIGHGQLSLSNQGKQVAYLPAANNAGLYFYGTGIDSIYTKENVYWLDKGAGTLMPVVEGTGPAPSPEGGSFTETVHLEEDVIPWETLFNDPNVDYWFWNQIFASNFYTDPARSFTFQPLGPAPQTTAVMQVHLFGGSDAGVTNDHHVVVSLNGLSVEDWWSGLTPHTITGRFPLQPGENIITVAAEADEGVSSSFILIDSFDITYKRLYDADGDKLFFRGDGAPSVTIGGFASAGIKVFDLTNPIIPKLNAATTIESSSASGTASYTVSLKPASANTPYIAVASAGIKAASAKAASFSKLSAKQNSADYIVIAPSELVSTAQGLADYRAGQGMKTMVVNLEDIMNEFNYGISSPEAIKSFLSVAHSKWKKSPRYVVLVGDGSLDYKDNLGFGGNLIPSKLVPTDFGLAMSDNYLADINGDHLPEIAIGRLPVANPAELQTVIGKIKTYERNLGNTRVVLVADTPGDGGDFIADSETLAGLFPYGYALTRIYLDDPAIVDAKRAALISAINQGAAFFNYVGHAGPDQLSNSGLLSYYPYPEYNPPTNDLPSLTNAAILPVMTAMTCGLGNFSDPYEDVLTEALLLKSDGGVAAAWSPTGLSDDSQAGILNREFYKAVFSAKKAVLGDAVLQALSVYKKQGSMPFMMDTYCILGDPALRIR
ncbi:MAG: C25 family cysteine peptidase [Thermodesulfovibrionales bacterium]